MAKIEMNNEMVLLRNYVRQARVCVINKLIREAKMLRNRHGDEAQQEKYKRKSDKLLAETYALKTIKDDAISKFGITNQKSLNDILQDQSSSNSDRVIARIVYYKTLHKKLMQFKETFPDYEKYTAGKKKKSTKLKKTKMVQQKSTSDENNQQTDTNPSTLKGKLCNNNVETEVLESSNDTKCENIKRKNDINLKRTKRPGELKTNVKAKDVKLNGKDRFPSVRKEKVTINKNNKTVNKSSVAGSNSTLHPSWTAKKKQQEMMKQGFQGKKIVFTDD